MQKKQTILAVTSLLLVVVLSVTLAYFTAQITGEGKNISVTSTDLKIVFTDTDVILKEMVQHQDGVIVKLLQLKTSQMVHISMI